MTLPALVRTIREILACITPELWVLIGVFAVVLVSVSVFGAAVIVTLARQSDRRRAEEEKLAAIGTAAERILHQIDDPVRTIHLRAGILRDERIVSDALQRRAVCGNLVGESQRLVAMLEELSQYAARRALARRPVRLDALVREVARREELEGSGTGLRVDASEVGEAVVLADAYALGQVLDNLVRNAREAMAEQPGPRLLRLTVSRSGGNAEVRVADNGPGIAPENLALIFEPFRSTRGKGMGLGLAICRDIVERHGGRLDVESTPGRGATFVVSLPLHTEAAPALSGANA